MANGAPSSVEQEGAVEAAVLASEIAEWVGNMRGQVGVIADHRQHAPTLWARLSGCFRKYARIRPPLHRRRRRCSSVTYRKSMLPPRA